jgi:hypothetical protein
VKNPTKKRVSIRAEILRFSPGISPKLKKTVGARASDYLPEARAIFDVALKATAEGSETLIEEKNKE